MQKFDTKYDFYLHTKSGFFWPSFSHRRILKMPKNWVFSLSFEFFPWVLSYFLEFWGFFLQFWFFSLSLGFYFSVFVATVAKLEGYLDWLSMQTCVMDIDTKPGQNKRLRWIKHFFRESTIFLKNAEILNFEVEFQFFPWVLRVFSPWVFSNGQKKPGLVSKYGEAHRPNKKPASYLPEWRQVDDDVFRKTCISNKNNYCSPHAVFLNQDKP